ncbi:hypothetical protein VP395_01655 [Mariniflexile soesokkakense]|uniref:Secreted protein n=1 Tax=Mariniflexile soesokkakense TaxID=1343160 RepID=A0ABV0A967_9FLAO
MKDINHHSSFFLFLALTIFGWNRVKAQKATDSLSCYHELSEDTSQNHKQNLKYTSKLLDLAIKQQQHLLYIKLQKTG